MEKISIIVPCYNVEKQIDRCVQSIINQTIGLSHLEIILVNDASKDATYEKILKWEAKYPDNILAINSTENLKQGGARNIGLSYVSGDYIGFLDSDDWIEPEMYQVLYDAIVEYDVDVASVLFERCAESGEVVEIERLPFPYGKKIVIDSVEARKSFLRQGLPDGIDTKLYRRELLERAQLSFPEHLIYEDNYFTSILAFYINSYIIFEKKLYHYMLNTQSTLFSKNSIHLDRLKIEKMKLDELRRRGFMDGYCEEIEAEFLKFYWCNMIDNFFIKFEKIPYAVIDEMRETVVEYFPKWKENPYIKNFNEISQIFLKIIEKKLSPAVLDEMAELYKNPPIEE